MGFLIHIDAAADSFEEEAKNGAEGREAGSDDNYVYFESVEEIDK